jgi:hypothetical protein
MVEIKDLANISKFGKLDLAPPRLLIVVVISVVDLTADAKVMIASRNYD